jgi:arsenate reductase (glutaredoxin)
LRLPPSVAVTAAFYGCVIDFNHATIRRATIRSEGFTMGDKITVYQKPTCSKCRAVLGILRDKGAEFESINYYEAPLTEAELKGLISKLGVKASEILRKDEPIYSEVGLGTREMTDDELIAMMVRYPDLIQRPIVVRGDRAVLGRPPQDVEKLL